jgi:1-acyl-sn-glycerol-3-phosphate acyltransferase
MPLPPLPEPADRKTRVIGLLHGALASIFLFSTLLFFNLLQTASLVIKLFSQKAFRKTNRWMANLWWGWCAIVAEKLNRTRVEFFGDPIPMRENAVVILNHQEMADITVIFAFARAKESLGDLKWFVKDVLKYVPGVGWGMLFLDCLFIKRDWTSDRGYIQQVFGKILKYRVPLWLMLFAEGTRFRPSKLERSQKYAREQGRTPLKHVLFPRTKGFVATIQSLQGHLDAVYDVTIGYINGVPTLGQWIKGYVKHVNLHVRRFHLDSLPTESDALSNWLIERYEEKDALLDAYYREGKFP